MSFKKEVSECKGCGSDKLIVNRTRWLCDDCNRKRLDDQNTGEKKIRKGLQTRSAIKAIKAGKGGLKRFTKKRQSIEVDYKKVQEEIWNERPHACDECGRPDRLSFSHLISRNKRTDLIAEKRNIVLHCMTFDGDVGCHERWEAGDETMRTFKKLTAIVKELIDEKSNR
tara:strand:- start:66049 stop:66555 length:507 start_codon:yes stop_codon:yes gene_type:complete